MNEQPYLKYSGILHLGWITLPWFVSLILIVARAGFWHASIVVMANCFVVSQGSWVGSIVSIKSPLWRNWHIATHSLTLKRVFCKWQWRRRSILVWSRLTAWRVKETPRTPRRSGRCSPPYQTFCLYSMLHCLYSSPCPLSVCYPARWQVKTDVVVNPWLDDPWYVSGEKWTDIQLIQQDNTWCANTAHYSLLGLGLARWLIKCYKLDMQRNKQV